jgi:hypothetical protein
MAEAFRLQNPKIIHHTSEKTSSRVSRAGLHHAGLLYVVLMALNHVFTSKKGGDMVNI